MRPIYSLTQPAAPAGAPRRWSISSLAAFRQCPRRWWLLNSRYSNTPDGRYPVPYGAATLRGRLVHEAVEAYANSWRSTGETPAAPPFSPRACLKKALREVLADADVNPRTDPRRLPVSIDDCVRDFYDLVEPHDLAHGRRVSGPTEPRIRSQATTPPPEAVEFWIEADDPPIGGIIDRVVDSGLIDFKTGEPSPTHAEQLVFYATIWWLRYGVTPRSMELRYAGGVDPVDVPVPAISDLGSIADKLRVEVSEANASLAAPIVPARPSSTNCVRCPVRQLCDEYWVSADTVTLRRPPSPASEAPAASFCDVRIFDLPSRWPRGGHLAGGARAQGLGEIQLFVDREKCPDDAPVRPLEARLLSAMVRAGSGKPEVRTTAATEAFWIMPQT